MSDTFYKFKHLPDGIYGYIDKYIYYMYELFFFFQEFTSSGSANSETSKVSGSLETKYKWVEYGLMFTEKWNTDNTLGTEITLEDQVIFGSRKAICKFTYGNL